MTLIKIPAALTTCVLAAVALSGCAPEPGASVSSDSTQPSPAQTSSPATQNRTATGILTSVDRQTTGRVEVQIEEVTDDSGITTPLATVEFFDLVTPYDHLTPGGALAPRGDDPALTPGSGQPVEQSLPTGTASRPPPCLQRTAITPFTRSCCISTGPRSMPRPRHACNRSSPAPR